MECKKQKELKNRKQEDIKNIMENINIKILDAINKSFSTTIIDARKLDKCTIYCISKKLKDKGYKTSYNRLNKHLTIKW